MAVKTSDFKIASFDDDWGNNPEDHKPQSVTQMREFLRDQLGYESTARQEAVTALQAVATTSAKGLMSAEDKAKFDIIDTQTRVEQGSTIDFNTCLASGWYNYILDGVGASSTNGPLYGSTKESGRCDLFVQRSTTADTNGYYSIVQTVYFRNANDDGGTAADRVYTRDIFYRNDSQHYVGNWRQLTNYIDLKNYIAKSDILPDVQSIFLYDGKPVVGKVVYVTSDEDYISSGVDYKLTSNKGGTYLVFRTQYDNDTIVNANNLILIYKLYDSEWMYINKIAVNGSTTKDTGTIKNTIPDSIQHAFGMNIATSSDNGLMSASDKQRLDHLYAISNQRIPILTFGHTCKDGGTAVTLDTTPINKSKELYILLETAKVPASMDIAWYMEGEKEGSTAVFKTYTANNISIDGNAPTSSWYASIQGIAETTYAYYYNDMLLLDIYTGDLSSNGGYFREFTLIFTDGTRYNFTIEGSLIRIK